MNTSSIITKLKETKLFQKLSGLHPFRKLAETERFQKLSQTAAGKFLTDYPLMVSVIAASVVLGIIFAVQKYTPAPEVTDTPPAVTTTLPAQTTTTAPLHAEIPSSEATTEKTMTETRPPQAEFERVEDSYFNDALFIGNSRTVGLSLFGSMPEQTTFYATVGMNIYDLLDSTAQIPPEEGPEMSFSSLMNGQKFGKIYIMLGINDLGTGTSESFAEYYKSVLDQIHQMQPEAIIYIQSIINVDAARDAQGDSINNANINEKNALLAELANDDYIHYLNVNEVLVDENGALNADYTSDGIHLGGGSLSIWEDYLRSHAVVKES
ncbi:MAG: hypothetical protein IJ496_01145 [Ruminococcus sp.]|nr:hypothetical protein [Ruminococcus sp.]